MHCQQSAVLCQGGRGGHTAAGQWRLHDYNQRIPERALVSIAHKYSLNTFNDKGKRWWVYNEFVTASSHRVMGRVEPDRVHVGVVVKCVGDGDGTDSRRWRLMMNYEHQDVKWQMFHNQANI